MTDEQREKTIDWQKITESFKLLKVQSERGMAITNVANVDDWLKALLRQFFIDDEKACDQVLEEPGSVSTFGARIDLAFALGLISKNERNMLNLIRKIRNEFSHSAKEKSFHTTPIKDRCMELDPAPKLWQSFYHRPLDPTKPDERFFAATSSLIIALVHRGEALQRRQEPGAVTDEQLTFFIEAAMKASEEHKGKG